ncbi:ABC transporter ATP-binding protein [Siminovitchia fortis]|uniref:ABC transporter ATP-binding protein n=1 Tax=Siminovitchia fortis TaxID=254758 RepID=UPI00119CBBD8|nr:ABC transporter ATP-binding protein [Siminovitchia fortis]
MKSESEGTAPKANWRTFLQLIAKTKLPKIVIVLAVILSFFETAGALIVPLFTGTLVDHLARNTLNGMLIFMLIGVFILQAAAGGLSYYLMSYMGELVVANMRKRLWKRVLHLPISYFDLNSSGETMSRINHDTETVKGLIKDHLISFVSGVITIIGAAVILFILDWRMLLIMLIVAPVSIVILMPVGGKMNKTARGMQDQMARFTASMSRVLSDIRLVKAYNAESDEERRGTDAIDGLFRFGLSQAKIMAIIGPLMGLVTMAVLVVLIGYGGARVASNTLSAGTLVAMILYMFQIVFPFTQLVSFFTEFQKAMGATERVQHILVRPPEAMNHTNVKKIVLPEGDKDIHFRNISFRYPSDERNDMRENKSQIQKIGSEEGEKELVLSGVNFSIPAGTMTAIVGPSGSGKSTMFALLEQFYWPNQGDILFGDMSIRDFELTTWRDQIGYVSQESPLMDGSIRDNICYGLADVTEERIRMAAEMAYAADFINELPEGYETQVGERGIKLSGGQRQRIAIARALIRNPKILLLDEATSSLDSDSEHKIQQALQSLMAGRTTLAIAHRLSTVVNASQIIVLEKGRITGIGTHSDLIETHTLYRRLAEQQFRKGDKDIATP